MNNSYHSAHIRHQYTSTGSWDYTILQINECYNVDFGDGYKFLVNPRTTGQNAVKLLSSSSHCKIDCDIQDHLINNQVTPMIRAWNGSLVFHASAISKDNTCWGFIGNSGAGKSTLAKSLSFHPSMHLWADDWLEVREQAGQFTTEFNPFATRLESTHAQALATAELINSHEDSNRSIGDKLLIDGPSQKMFSDKQPLQFLCEISPCPASETVSIERLKPSDAFQRVSQHLYRLDTTNPLHMQREFNQLTQLVKKIPVYQMSYPHSLEKLRDLPEILIDSFVNCELC